MNEPCQIAVAKADFSPVVAIGGLICLMVLMLTGLQHQQLTNLPKVFPSPLSQQPPLAMHRLTEADLADTTPELEMRHLPTEQLFQGKFEGFSIEGDKRNNYTLDLKREGKEVKGKLKPLFGEAGEVRGHVNGNTLIYRWQVGQQSGRGLYIQEEGTLRGTWGYAHSAQNGGRSLLHLQR